MTRIHRKFLRHTHTALADVERELQTLQADLSDRSANDPSVAQLRAAVVSLTRAVEGLNNWAWDVTEALQGDGHELVAD